MHNKEDVEEFLKNFKIGNFEKFKKELSINPSLMNERGDDGKLN